MAIIVYMESLLIVIAIVIAVFLTVRSVMQPYRPDFALKRRVPTRGIAARARALGKKCAAVERGSGLSLSTLSPLRREYKALKRRSDDGKSLTSAQTVCAVNRDAVLGAAERAKTVMRKSYALGHVDKRPRLFLLCDMLVSDMRGYLDAKLVKTSVKAFCESAPLAFSELEGLPDMLRLCLCGLIMRVLGEENARAEVYDSGMRDGGDGKIDIGRLSDHDYLCGVADAVTSADKSAFDALIESNAVDTESARQTRRKRLALAYSAVYGAVRSLAAVNVLDLCALIELCAADKVLCGVDGYSEESEQVKADYLRACEREAKRRGTGECAYAHSVADSAATVGCKISDYITAGDKDGKKPIYTAIAVSLVVLAGVIICLTFSYRYAAVFPIFAIAIYALFRRRLIIPKIDLMRRKYKASNAGITEYVPPVRLAYFGGETDYKQNTIDGGRSRVVADNRGKVTVKSEHGTAELGLDVSANSERIRLAAFDGVFSSYKNTYRVVAENAEFSAEFIAPIDGAGCSVRVTAINRTDVPVAIGIFAAAKKSGKKKNVEFSLVNTTRETPYAVALCSDRACSEHDGARGDAELSERFTLDGYQKRSVVINTLFAENASLLSRRAVAACGSGSFECDEAAAREYCADTDSFAGLHEPMPSIEPYKKVAHIAADVELPTLAYDVAADFGGYTRDGGLLPLPGSGTDVKNVMCDGEYCTEIYADGDSVRVPDINGETDADLTAAFIALGENGIIWTPTLRPLGRGNLYAVHHIGHSEFVCGYNGFVCTLRRYIALGGRGEFFDVTLANKTDRQRETDVMLSVRSDVVCDTIMDSGRLLARDADGKVVFGLQASERINEYAEFAEGYFVRGVVDRASGFRPGGVLHAPTVSTRVSVMPKSAARVVFLLRCGDGAPFKPNAVNADAALAACKNHYEKCARFTARTGDRALNKAFMWVQYALINAVKASELADSGNAARDIVLFRAARYFDISAVKRKILKLCTTQHRNGLCGNSEISEGRLVTDLLALPILAASYVDLTREFGILGEFAEFCSEQGESDGGASVLEHCLRAVDLAVQSFANGKKNMVDAMTLRFAVKRYVQYCAESARKRRFEAAARYIDYALTDAFDGTAFSSFSDAPAGGKIELMPQIMCALTGACGVETATTALHTAKNKLYDAKSGKMRLSSDSDELAELAVMLLYAAALYKIDRCDEAFEVLRDCYRRGAVVTDSVGAQALFYSVTAECVFGVKFVGEKIKLDPAVGGNVPDIAFDISTERGRARVTVDNDESCGAWRMRMNNVVYSTDSVDLYREGEFDITLFRDGTRVD